MTRRPSPPDTPLARASAALAVLGSVFALYLQPGFMVTLAQQVWACF